VSVAHNNQSTRSSCRSTITHTVIVLFFFFLLLLLIASSKLATCLYDGAYEISGYDNTDCSATSGKAAIYTGTGTGPLQCLKLAPDVYAKVACHESDSSSSLQCVSVKVFGDTTCGQEAQLVSIDKALCSSCHAFGTGYLQISCFALWGGVSLQGFKDSQCTELSSSQAPMTGQ
jgi:hypothetical protein